MTTREPKKNPFLCFIHIEKCGGITLQHLIQYNFWSYVRLRSWLYWSNSIEAIFTKEDLRRLLRCLPFISGIGGHTTRTFAGYEDVLGHPIFYLTFLRDPVSRYMSHFNYQRQVMKINWTVNDFLSEQRFNDFQVIRIAGERDLKKAKETLKSKFAFCGLIEFFDHSLVLLNNLYDIGFQSIFYEKFNVAIQDSYTLSYDNLPDRLKKRVMNNNRLDIELYKFASEELFPKVVSRYKGDLENDVAMFRMKNASYRYPRLRWYVIRFYRNFYKYTLLPMIHINQ